MSALQHRALLAGGVVALAALGAGLVASALRSNLVFFYSPSDIASGQTPTARTFRLGGLVQGGSLVRHADGIAVRFSVTGTARQVPVEYRGILPDLFKEGSGVVAQGRLHDDGVFHAVEVLARRDENYMPAEAADALRRARHVLPAPGGVR